MSESRAIQWNSRAISHVGAVRKNNEDSFLHRPDLGVWVVADGMGGHAAGDVASQTVVECMTQMPSNGSLSALVDAAEDKLLEANRRLLALAVNQHQRTIGSTAVALLERTPVHAGEKVLVAPGVGGLGSLLVQLLVRAGATVIAGVRGGEKAAIAEKLGARAVDYSEPGWTGRLPDGVDVAFDGIGGDVGAAALALLVNGGRFSAYGMVAGGETVVGEADRRRLEAVVGMAQLPEFWADTPRRVQHVLNEAAAGRLTPIIGRIYPLAEAAAAHADIEARRFVGKLLLTT